jgi:hydroxymethylpyrimidine pyrophosphatase-like HAD family hydrolase
MMQEFINDQSKIIAVDFDGTIVEHKYPAIGKEMLFAFATLKALQQKGHKLILWTIRTGPLLEEAIAYCKNNGVEFYSANCNYPEEVLDEKTSRKLNVDIFIDDRNVGGFIGWSEVWNTLHPEGGEFSHQLKNELAHTNFHKKEVSFFNKLLGKK